jgi:hypothetical protein
VTWLDLIHASPDLKIPTMIPCIECSTNDLPLSSLVVMGVAVVQHTSKKESKPAIFLRFSANTVSLTQKQVAHQFLKEKQVKFFFLKIPNKI